MVSIARLPVSIIRSKGASHAIHIKRSSEKKKKKEKERSHSRIKRQFPSVGDESPNLHALSDSSPSMKLFLVVEYRVGKSVDGGRNIWTKLITCAAFFFVSWRREREREKKKKTPSGSSFDDSIGASPHISSILILENYVGKQKSALFVSLSHFQRALSRRVAARFFPPPTPTSDNMLRHSTHRCANGCIVLLWCAQSSVATIKNSTLLLFFPPLSLSLFRWFLRRI